MSVLRRLLLMLAVALATAGGALAHEAAMGVLEFREVRPGGYVGGWKLEPTMGGDRVKLRVPPHCFLRLPQLECGEKGLVGTISIDNMGANMSAVVIRVIPIDGDERSYTLTAGNPKASVVATGAPTWSTWIEIVTTYLNVGIDHILLGADHLLFVLGLIWLVPNGWRLVKTITAFTVGHSISLAAAAFGLIGIPERPLNACIALSIVFVGVEIVKATRGEAGLTMRYPWLVAGGFGLVHGIGFASALAGLGIEHRLLPVALLSFNVGLEIGQLAFVLLVLALRFAHRRLQAELPAWGAVVPGYAIGVVSMFWFIGRLVRVLTPV
jgi:HupE / UreJ protein